MDVPSLPPSLPRLPFSLLNLLQKTPLVSAPDAPGKLLLLHYPTTLGNPNSGRTLGAPCFLLPRVPSRLPSSLSHPLGPQFRKIRPLFPVYPHTRTVQPQASPPLQVSAFVSPPPTPDPVASSAQRLLEGSWRMPPGSPPSAPAVLWVLASRTAARSCSGLREQVRAAAAWRAPAPRPGEEGRAPARPPGWGWSAPALPRPPPSILRLPLTATSFPNLRQFSPVLQETIQCDNCRTKLERSVRWGKCGLHLPAPGVRGCLMKQGRGASGTWPEAPTPTLAGIPLAQTRHSGCWGVRWGRSPVSSTAARCRCWQIRTRRPGSMARSLPSCPVPRWSQSPSPRLCVRAAPSLEKMSQP